MLGKKNDDEIRLKKNNPIQKETCDEPCYLIGLL